MSPRSLEKGQKVRLSQMGHRDFLYPSDRVETLVEDTFCEVLPYVGGRPWVAVKIPASSIYASEINARYLVVWVEPRIFHAA